MIVIIAPIVQIFSTNLKIRVRRTVLVRISSSEMKKIKMATKIQDDCQFPAFFALRLNFCNVEHSMVILVSVPRFRFCWPFFKNLTA